MVKTFWGLEAEWWTVIATLVLAIFTLALAIATSLLVFYGRQQIMSIRREAKRERTLSYCHRYDSDPILDGALRRLGKAREDKTLARNSATRADIATVLNYLDGLATGIEQHLYIEELARDYMEPVLLHHVEQYLGGGAPDLGVKRDEYTMLLALADRWRALSIPPKTHYNEKNDRRS